MDNDNTEQVRHGRAQGGQEVWTKPKWLILTAVGLAALVLGALIFLAVTNRIAIAFGVNQQAVVRMVACDSDTVVRYNDINRRSLAAQTDSDFEGFTQEFDDLAKDIVSKTGFTEDVTCQYILFLTYQYKGDATNMKEVASAIIALHEKGQFINNEVGQQIHSITEFKEILSNETSE